MEQLTPKVRSWASIAESQALQQAIRTAHMPQVYPYLAIMPDIHFGRGCCVGVAIPTRGAIFPSAVGVDIGCVDADSEYLSPYGWRKISEYAGGQVMQYDPDKEIGQFVTPAAYIVKPCEEFYYLKTRYGINQMLSADHRVLCWKITGRSRERVRTVMTAEEFTSEHARLKLGDQSGIPHYLRTSAEYDRRPDQQADPGSGDGQRRCSHRRQARRAPAEEGAQDHPRPEPALSGGDHLDGMRLR